MLAQPPPLPRAARPALLRTTEAGLVIASTRTSDGSGSIAVTRGAKIQARGTADEPIIFTSTNDTATWVDGDPKTGTWREAANEWGNLTIMGRAYVSNSFVDGNSATFGNNESPMEGLIPDFAGDPNTAYGGTDDDYSAGALAYVSIRYGGRVVGLANELNGLSLGGIGRGTDIDHIEIMNNVDDGIEIWGAGWPRYGDPLRSIGRLCTRIIQGNGQGARIGSPCSTQK